MITITQTPDTHNSVFRAIIFKCTSNATADDLRLKCELFVQGSSVANLFATAIDDVFEFDLSNIIHAYINPEMAADTLGVQELDGNALPFYCVFTEYYNNEIGILSPYGTITSSTYKANNINLNYYESNFSDYILNDLESRFLTSAPNSLLITVRDKPHLYFITNETDITVFVEKVYEGGSDTDNYPITFAGNKFAAFVLEITDPSVLEVNIYVETIAEQISETRNFKVVAACDEVRLEWLNDLGGLDGYNFPNLSDIVIDTTKTEISRFVASNYTPDYHKVQPFFSSTSEKKLLRSGFVNVATASWLASIIRSKKVWQNENESRKAVKVNTTSVSTKNQNNLVQVEIEIELMPFDNY
jgi:hypothetical protein